MLHPACFLLVTGLLPGLFQSNCHAAPTHYDQRQDGKNNYHAKLDNILIIFAPSENTDLLANLATQVMGLKQLASRQSQPSESAESVVYETEEDNRGREPYHVEIVRIEKEGEAFNKNKQLEKSPKIDSNDDPKKSEAGIKEKSKDKIVEGVNEPKTSASPDVDDKKDDKKARSFWRRNEDRKIDESPEEGKVSVLKYPSEMADLEQPQEDSPIRDETLKAGRPGTSLKKQLSRKENEDVSSIFAERNDVRSVDGKPQELKLLGGGIENCGPGRYRDKSGICQFDKNFN